MGYVDFRAAAELPCAASRLADSDQPGLGHCEWSVVDNARDDGLWSLKPDALLPRLVRILFGIRPRRPFANERLEALRRFAVIAWNKRSVTRAQIRDVIDAGFSDRDAREVLMHISRRRQLQSWPRGLA